MKTPITKGEPGSLSSEPVADNGGPVRVTAQRKAFSSAEIAFLIGAPLAWAVLLLLHPTGDGEDLYPVVSDEVTAWLIVHVGTLLFVPLIAAAVYLLLRGVDGTAAQVSRVALGSFVLFYVTFEVLIGIGVGLFTDEVNGLPAAEQPAAIKAIEAFADSGVIRTFELIGTGSLFAALTAAGTALRRSAGAPLAVPVLFVLAAVPIAWHVTPFGQVGLALFIAAVLLVVRARTVPRVVPADAVRPAVP
jgi:hypothetical protein